MASIAQSCNAISPSKNGVEMQKLLEGVRQDMAALTAAFNLLRTDYNAHAHAGVTVGAGSSSVVTATTASAVAMVTTA